MDNNQQSITDSEQQGSISKQHQQLIINN